MTLTRSDAAPPFLPFTRPSLDESTIAAVAEVLRSGQITSGPKVAAFEAALSAYFGGRIVRAFANGTASLEIALRIAGVGPGDEVITTPISWVATSNVVLAVGARPVFVDIDPLTRNLDLNRIEAAITPRTRAILPVYLAGLPVNMDQLYGIARRHGLRVVEDAAQALGSRWGDQRIGQFGDLVSFSFQANKNITSIEGGALVLNTPEEATLAEKYRLQGVVRTGFDGMEVDLAGGKFNLTDVNAAVGLGQFARIEAVTARRAALARRYFAAMRADGIEAFGIELPVEDFARANWHLFQIVLPTDRLKTDRAGFMAGLAAMGIGTGVHYPPIHLFKLYRELGWKPGILPIAERIGRAILTLPMFAAMEDSDVERVTRALRQLCLQCQQ